MSVGPGGQAARSGRQARAGLHTRLQARRDEIEQAALARVRSIQDPAEAGDPAYAEALRVAVSVALDYGLATIEGSEEAAPPLPAALLVQARIAARSGVSLDTVLRRYFAGYALLGDFLIEEVEEGGLLSGAELKGVLRTQAVLFDRLLAAVSEEHGREDASRPTSSEQRRAEQVRRLLAGEPIDVATLAYDFDACHLALVASGPDAAEPLRRLAGSLDRRLLLVRAEEQTAWAWFGGRRPPERSALQEAISSHWPVRTALALGEPGEGIAGWRLSHRQARAALGVARHGPQPVVRYADVALLAAGMRDDLFATSLRQLYLTPLETERDGGKAARETLRAYFRAGRNVSSTAAALGVKRHTVTNRLRAIEERIGRPLESCASDIEVALRLEEIPPVLPPNGYRRRGQNGR